ERADGGSRRDTRTDRHDLTPHDEPEDRAGAGAERAPDSDLSRQERDRTGHRTVEADRGQRQCDRESPRPPRWLLRPGPNPRAERDVLQEARQGRRDEPISYALPPPTLPRHHELRASPPAEEADREARSGPRQEEVRGRAA